MSDLKPCPFCGGTDIEYHYQGSSDWSFECKGCPVHASFWVRLKKDEDWDEVKEGDKTGEHARVIQYWNTRAELPNKHLYTGTAEDAVLECSEGGIEHTTKT
jgi:hypothetical protein